MERQYEVILYGATGFTGQLCAEYLGKSYPDLRWAIAGRNKDKLEKVKKKFALRCDIFVANGSDLESLRKFVSQTKVVASTAGPFARYGSKLVEACVLEGAHYCDSTGETHWIKGLIERHHEEAKRKGVRIIPSCGYDSIPSDLGTFFTVSHCKKPVREVNLYQQAKGGISGGTTETMFSRGELPKEMSDPFLLNPKGSVSEKQRKLSKDGIKIEKVKELGLWSGIGLMALVNTRTVRRSVALMEENGKSYGKDFIFREFGAYKKQWVARVVSSLLVGLALTIKSPFKGLLRKVMKKPGEGPSKEERESGWFRSNFVATMEDGSTKVCRISSSGDPGYKCTSMMVSESALCLARSKNLPGGEKFGGILTPSVAFENEIIERLKKKNFQFEA